MSSFGLMHDRDGERQTLSDTKRQIAGPLIEIVRKSKLLDEFIDAALRVMQMKEPRMQDQILL